MHFLAHYNHPDPCTKLWEVTTKCIRPEFSNLLKKSIRIENTLKSCPTVDLVHNYTLKPERPSCSHLSLLTTAGTECWVSSHSRLLHQKPHRRQQPFTSAHKKKKTSLLSRSALNYPSFHVTINSRTEFDFLWFSQSSALWAAVSLCTFGSISPLRVKRMAY